MKSVIILSGGMDSTTLLYWLKAEKRDIYALSFDYGQRHAKELGFGGDICARLGVSHQIVDLSALKRILRGSSQTDDIPVPEGHYAEESMKLTVVPNRNMVMLAVAAGYGMSLKAGTVSYAAHAGDHAIYPDCRPEFADALDRAIELADWHRIRLERPFIGKTKADIARIGHELGVPFEKTWSCYKGLEKHCGKCGTCTERKEAFQLAGVPDPTEYE